MSGILDKKSRLFDYTLTNNGRDQLSRSEMNIKYASLSDQSIVYYKDYEKTKTNKSFVDASENFYFPFESSFKDNNFISEENLIENNYRNVFSFNITGESTIENIVSTAIDNIINSYSFSAKIKNKKIILNKSYIKSDSLSFKISGNYDNNIFDFKDSNNTNSYPTNTSSIIDIQNLPVLAFDKRFETKNNFLKLSPLNSEGVKIFNDESFNNMLEFNNSNKINSILKGYNKKINFTNDDRDSVIIDTIRNLYNDKKVYKKVYEIKDVTESDTLYFELFELGKSRENFEIEKLNFIDCGEFYDNIDGKLKKVYLIGKIVNSKNKDDIISNIFKENDRLGNLDTSFITEIPDTVVNSFTEGVNSKNRYFILSSYYSFINMFILVAE